MRKSTATKVFTLSEAAHWRAAARRRKQRVVATNGCFDLLHYGHVYYLQQAKTLGDLLVVGLNSDRSVRELKGPNRPLIPQKQRAAILTALNCVDAVVIFGQKRAHRFLATVRPHVYVKGGDYRPGTFDAAERAVLTDIRAKIRILPFVRGISTTRLIHKIAEAHDSLKDQARKRTAPER